MEYADSIKKALQDEGVDAETFAEFYEMTKLFTNRVSQLSQSMTQQAADYNQLMSLIRIEEKFYTDRENERRAGNFFNNPLKRDELEAFDHISEAMKYAEYMLPHRNPIREPPVPLKK